VSEAKALETLVEFPLSWDEIETLPPDQRAALGIICFAFSEINALMRMYAFSQRSLSGDEAIDMAVIIQNNVLLRTWSAKIYEFSEFLRFHGDHKTTDATLLELAHNALLSFEAHKKAEGYSSARNLRHEASNHYLLGPVKKNLNAVSRRANCSLYLHEMTGNSFYPLGEEIVFLGRLNRQGLKLETEEERQGLYQAWWDWCLATTKWQQSVTAKFLRRIILDNFPDKKPQRKDHWLSLDLVGNPELSNFPVFIRRPT
jgi:hypothetical protein